MGAKELVLRGVHLRTIWARNTIPRAKTQIPTYSNYTVNLDYQPVFGPMRPIERPAGTVHPGTTRGHWANVKGLEKVP